MMNKFQRIASALALGAIAIPASANPRDIPFDTRDGRGARTFMFSGATMNVPLDGRRAPQPEIAMRIAGGSKFDSGVRRIGDGISFGTGAGTKAAMKIGGHDTRDLERRLKMSDGAKTALIVGGVALVAVAVLVATQAGKVPANAYWDEED